MSRRDTETGNDLVDDVQVEMLAALVQVSPQTEEQKDLNNEEISSSQHTEDFNAS